MRRSYSRVPAVHRPVWLLEVRGLRGHVGDTDLFQWNLCCASLLDWAAPMSRRRATDLQRDSYRMGQRSNL
jgi:hypothetical protein